jgi:murein DD-endopeptidase MepM/ murein hydrolase activator NlpD
VTQPAGIDLSLNAGQYLSMSQQVLAQNAQLMTSLSGFSQAAPSFGRGWDQAAPTGQHISRLRSFQAAAMDSQKAMSGFAAAQAAGGASASVLGRGIRNLAVDMPIGQQGAMAIVGTISQLGIGSKTSAPQVLALSKTVAQLQQAVGGNGPQLGSGLIQLERTFGDQGVDPVKVRKTADALTTVSTQLGASAQGTLDFANNIGPFTQAAGIGKTASLGIAAAFSRIGQDGSYAANTVGTLLQGVNRAVTEGTPDLSKYANIVGTTASHFQSMFKANPAQVLTQMTQALAQGGPRTMLQMEGLGLDSVRSQRALQALIQSGGLESAISTATSGYGSGSTSKASAAAQNNVIDSFTRVKDSGLSLAQSLGTPLLQPIGIFAKTLAAVTGGLSKTVGSLLGSGTGGHIASAALALGGMTMLAKRFVGPLAIGGATLASAPVRAGLAGMALGRYGGDVEAAQASRLGRLATAGMREGTITPFDRAMQNNTQVYAGKNWRGETEDRNGDPIMRNKAAQSFFSAGSGWGAARYDAAGMPTTGGLGIGRTIGRAAMYPISALGAAMTLGGDAYRQSRLAMSGRSTQMLGDESTGGEQQMRGTPRGAWRTAAIGVQDAWRGGGGFSGVVRGGGMGDFTSETSKALKGLNSELIAAGGATKAAGGALKAFSYSLVESGKMVGTAGMGGLRLGGSLAGSALGGIGKFIGGNAAMMLPMAGIMLGTGLAAAGKKQAAGENAAVAGNTDMYAQLNAYAEASGQATKSGTTAPTTGLATTAPVVTGNTSGKPGSGFGVTDAMVQQAAATRSKVVTKYGKELTPQQIAAQVNAQNVQGLTGTQAQTVGTDLLRQGFSRETVNKIMTQVKPLPAATPAPVAPGGLDTSALTTSGAGVNINVGGAALPFSTGGILTDRNGYNAVPEGDLNASNPRNWGTTRGLRGTANQQIGATSSEIRQQATAQSSQFGQKYGLQEELKNMNKAVAEATASGNAKYAQQLIKQFSFDLTGKKTSFLGSNAANAGGFAQELARTNPEFKKTLDTLTGQGGTLGVSGKLSTQQLAQLATLDQGTAMKIDAGQAKINYTAGAGLNATPQLSLAGQQMKPFGPLGTFYDNTAGYPQARAGDQGNQAGMRALGKPDQFAAARAATQTFLDDPGNVAKQTAAVNLQIAAATKSGTSIGDLAVSASKAAGTINDASDAAYQLNVALQAAAEQRMNIQSGLQGTGANLQQQFSYGTGLVNANAGINSDPAKANYAKGQGIQGQTIDQVMATMKTYLNNQRQYEIQSARMTSQFNIQQGDAQFDFQRQQGYAYTDYLRSRQYATDDYNKGVTRTNEDYQRQQQRQERDFNLQMARAQQDYLITRQRAVRDFNINLARQIQDQTKALYDPYERIQTKAVWDAKDLLVNMNQQNAMIKQQSGQLAQVRGMGLSENSIAQLKLNDPANAQQLSKMVSDLMQDPALVKQVNDSVAARLSLGKALVTDPQNIDIARAKTDFATQLKDQAADYAKNVARARADNSKSLGDEAADLARTLGRMGADEGIALQRMDDAYAISSQRAADVFATQTARAARDYQTAMWNMKIDLDVAQQEITTSFADTWKNVQKAMAGQQLNWTGMMKTGVSQTLKFVQDNSGDFAKAYSQLVGGDISQLFPVVGGHHSGQGGPGVTKDKFSKLFSSVNSGQWPVDKPTVTQHFGQGGHPGIDLAVPTGTEIHSPIGGIVVDAGSDPAGYGNYAIVSHGGGRASVYGHQQKLNVKKGNLLNGGDLIGWVDSTGDSTGPHLHFETRQDGQVQDPEKTLPRWKALATGNEAQDQIYHGPMSDVINTAALYAMIGDYKKKPFVVSGPTGDGKGGTTVGNLPDPKQGADAKAYAKSLLASFGWGPEQFDPLNQLWTHESGWNVHAMYVGPLAGDGTPRNSPYGIPQSYPGSKMESEGADWANNFAPQVRWGLKYIKGHSPGFTSPSEAWGQWMKPNGQGSYGDGGVAVSGAVTGTFGERGPEAVIPLNQMGISVMAEAMKRAIGPDDIRSMLVAGHASPVTYHTETHTVDQGVHLEGPISVRANDPNELVKALAAQKRAKALVKSGRPHP